MVTQKDIAKKVGVSSCTVSRVINKKGYLSKSIIKKVNAVIQELNYKPNLVARSLKLKKSKTIGFIFPDIENPFFIGVIKKAEEAAYKNGYSVILCNTENDPVKEKKYIEALKGKFIDGYLYISSITNNDNLLKKELNHENVVCIDRALGLENEICVKLDNFKAIKIGTEYLINSGHKKIGIIGIPINISPGFERYEGFKQTMLNNRIKINKEFIKFTDFSIDHSYKLTKELLSLKKRPTAIITFSNFSTIGALTAIKELNFKIPGDLSIIGFDDLIWAKLITPALTVISQPIYKFGELGVNLLIKRIEGEKINYGTILLDPELIIRDSCQKII